jgi:hypothetical protein
MNTKTTICPGCGLVLPQLDGPLLVGYNASAECIALFSQLSAYTNSLGDAEFSHQHVVDAYGAQHVGVSTKKVVPTMTLVGLYLMLEHGYTGKQVQRAHMAIADQTKDWPDFNRPTDLASMTILDVLKVPDAQKNEILHTWCKAVWESWKSEREKVITFTHKYLEYLQ